MQKEKKGFLGSILSGMQNKQPTQGPSNLRRESKIQEIRIEESTRDINLYLQIPSHQYQFMLQLDQTLSAKADQIFTKNQRNDFLYSEQFVDEIKNILKEQLELYKIIEEKDKEIEIIKQQNNDIVQSLMSKDSICENIEQNYMEQLGQMKIEKLMLIQSYENQLETLSQKLECCESELKISKENAITFQREIELIHAQEQKWAEKYASLDREKQKLKQDLELFKELRTGSLVIKNIFQQLLPEQQIDQKKKDDGLFLLFAQKFRSQMIKYFTPLDLYSLMLLSKRMYFTVRNNRILFSHIVQCKTQKYVQMIGQYQQSNNYFFELADQIPDEILQQGIAKFLAFRLSPGNYMAEIFREALDLIESKPLDDNKSQPVSQYSNSQQYSEYFEKSECPDAPNEDLLGIQQQQQPSPTLQSQTQPSQQKHQGFFSRLKSNHTTPQPSKQQSKQQTQNRNPDKGQGMQNLNELVQQLQRELQFLGNVCIQALSIPFLREQLTQNRQDMQELNQRAVHMSQQLYSAGQRCIENSESIQHFIHRLQQCFAKLFTHAHYLRLECQQLYLTMSYLAQVLMKQNKQLSSMRSDSEDIVEQAKTLKQMNYFLQSRVKQLEERVHKGEEDVLTLGKANFELNQVKKENDQELNELREKVKEKEGKIKLLAVNIKTINNEKQTSSKRLEDIQIQFSKLKNLLTQSQN